VVGANLMTPQMAPLTADNGGTSVSNPDAGATAPTFPHEDASDITTADRAGAGVLTVLVVIGMIGGAWWLVK
jgi:hypothetical protein